MDKSLENDVLAPLAKCEDIAATLSEAFTAVGVSALTLPIQRDGRTFEVVIRELDEDGEPVAFLIPGIEVPETLFQGLHLPPTTRALTLTCEVGNLPTVHAEYYPSLVNTVRAKAVKRMVLERSEFVIHEGCPPVEPPIDESEGGHCD